MSRNSLPVDLSVVWASRDDNFGGSVIQRLVSSINSISRAGRAAGLNLEKIVVDWNSPISSGLCQKLRQNNVTGVRVINVPSSLASRYSHLSARAFVEPVAKNVGLARAVGEQILITNSDIEFSPRIMSAIFDRPHPLESFLRLDRTDWKPLCGGSFFPVRVPLRLHKRHGRFPEDPILEGFACQFSRPRGTQPLDGEEVVGRYIVSPPGGLSGHFLRGIHSNAAGDFLLAHRGMWKEVRGYFEDRWLDSMGDSLLVSKFFARGFRQVVLSGPKLLWHKDHPRDDTRGGTWHESRWESFKGEMTTLVDSQAKFGAAAYGLSDVHLDECLV